MNHHHYPYRHQAYIQQQPDSFPPGTAYQQPPPAYQPMDIPRPYPESFQQLPTQPSAPASDGGLFGGGRAGQIFGDIQNFVNRMGGIDGILNTVGKVQKLMSTVQQVAPMISLLLKKNPPEGSLSQASYRYARSTRRRRRKGQRSRSRSSGSRRTCRSSGTRRSFSSSSGRRRRRL